MIVVNRTQVTAPEMLASLLGICRYWMHPCCWWCGHVRGCRWSYRSFVCRCGFMGFSALKRKLDGGFCRRGLGDLSCRRSTWSLRHRCLQLGLLFCHWSFEIWDRGKSLMESWAFGGRWLHVRLWGSTGWRVHIHRFWDGVSFLSGALPRIGGGTGRLKGTEFSEMLSTWSCIPCTFCFGFWFPLFLVLGHLFHVIQIT